MCDPKVQKIFKAIEDRLLGTLFLLAGLPVMVIASILIKLTSPGPVLFIQKRKGLNGERIRVFKFRTMQDRRQRSKSRSRTGRPDPSRGGANGYARQVKTPVGRLLRATSIDELPQLFNVIKGDMSLVGPRPHPPRLDRQYMKTIEHLPLRNSIKPGITGLAQISGSRGPIRSADDMRRRVDYDLEYIRKWSPILDLKIIGLTLVKGFINRETDDAGGRKIIREAFSDCRVTSKSEGATLSEGSESN
jgi:lipopolysaccharide/colanic/teichoic acid biosynthesis glycosyltransferase